MNMTFRDALTTKNKKERSRKDRATNTNEADESKAKHQDFQNQAETGCNDINIQLLPTEISA